ncbi:MAG: SwmB domain-containing protein, partial [Gemmatimonadetes bacterium]|nr:SwmB domain-containing protein [Gemmatimonadota bacterium]
MTTSRGSLHRHWRFAAVSAMVACAGLAAPSGANAHNFVPSGSTARPFLAHDAMPAAAVPPTITMRAEPSGTGHEKFTLTVTFSQSVTGFREEDIDLSAGDLDDFSGSGTRYFATIEPPSGFEGTIHVSIAAKVAQNSSDEDNVAAAYSFYADNKVPELDDAFVDADELVLVYDDDLDAATVPGTSDFTVRVEGRTRSISRVEVARDEVTLSLDTPVSYRDEVTVSYRPGTRGLSDHVGNVVDALIREPVRNTTSEDAGAPGPPRSLSATADGSSAIDLDWTEPADSGAAAVDGYRIEVSSNGGRTWDVLVRDTRDDVTSYSHTGLAAHTTRHYRVSAINDFGVSEPSNTASATILGRVPGAPTGLTAAPLGSSRINLRWRAGAAGSGGAVTGYRIEVSPNGLSG